LNHQLKQRNGGANMKNLIFLIILTIFLAGCSSDFYKHDSIYKDWDHAMFSWWEYENPTAEHAKMSDERGWWGEEIPYIPVE
jgi:hypothetical protein